MAISQSDRKPINQFERQQARAAIFAVEYKLEPSRPEDTWLSPESLHSKSATHQIDGLAPAQLVRVRVRAFGDGWGPYSAEVVGRAK